MFDWNTRTTLTHGDVQVEPMTLDHEAGMREAAADGELWNILVTSVPEPENTRAYIESALKMRDDGNREPFVVRDLRSGKLMGSSSYHDIVPAIKRVEIGYTWYAKSTQRTKIFSQYPLLLLFGYQIDIPAQSSILIFCSE